jgi:hypothetical protein
MASMIVPAPERPHAEHPVTRARTHRARKAAVTLACSTDRAVHGYRARMIDMRAFAYGHDWPNSQADSAGSIPVTCTVICSAGKTRVKRGLLRLCLDRSRGSGQLRFHIGFTRDPRGLLGSGGRNLHA